MPLSTLACPPSANYLAKFRNPNFKYEKAKSPIYLRESIDSQEIKK
jgi:hypothetical protein